MHLILAVGQGAEAAPPRLIELEYTGDPSTDRRRGLVGKGITFDTGGLSIKPSGGMVDMHYDMSGGANALGRPAGVPTGGRPRIDAIDVAPGAGVSPGALTQIRE